MKLKICILLSSILVLSSCTFQKRLYRKGFYIDWNKNSAINISNTRCSSRNTFDNTINSSSSLTSNTYSLSCIDFICPHCLESADKKVLSFNKQYSILSSSMTNRFFSMSNYLYVKKQNVSKTHTTASTYPAFKSQIISIMFQLLNLLLCANHYMFFYLDPFFWLRQFGFFMFLILSIILILSYYSFVHEKDRNYKAINYRMNKMFILFLMLLMGFLLPLGILYDKGLSALPYPVWFFWGHIIFASLLFIGSIFLIFSSKSELLEKESEIINEPDVSSNEDMFKKIQLLRTIKKWIFIVSLILIIIPFFLLILY